jgi:hypothetical protein
VWVWGWDKGLGGGEGMQVCVEDIESNRLYMGWCQATAQHMGHWQRKANRRQ